MSDDGDLMCRRCFEDLMENEQPMKTCHGCAVVHLATRMAEKITGLYCRDCAHKYELNVLFTMFMQDSSTP
jgi:hypothetical protein